MILVFGGTTEGRKAVEVLEEAGTPYYYSTKTGEQDIVLHNGQRTDGALDAEAIRVVKSAPRWTPGMMEGRAVNVTYTFPVIFELR